MLPYGCFLRSHTINTKHYFYDTTVLLVPVDALWIWNTPARIQAGYIFPKESRLFHAVDCLEQIHHTLIDVIRVVLHLFVGTGLNGGDIESHTKGAVPAVKTPAVAQFFHRGSDVCNHGIISLICITDTIKGKPPQSTRRHTKVTQHEAHTVLLSFIHCS